MLKNGKYTITFQTPLGDGTGFVIMEDGKMVGGDSDYIYTGSYYEKGAATKARILIDNYSGRKTFIFGEAKYLWLKAVYAETKNADGFKGKAVVVDVTPAIPGIEGTTVPIYGKLLDN